MTLREADVYGERPTGGECAEARRALLRLVSTPSPPLTDAECDRIIFGPWHDDEHDDTIGRALREQED